MPNMVYLATQDEWWVTREGKRVRIAEMHPRHAHNAAEMLSRNQASWSGPVEFVWMRAQSQDEAKTIEMAGDVAGEHLRQAFDAALGEDVKAMREGTFIERFPLMQALRARAKENVHAFVVRIGDDAWPTEFSSWSDWRSAVRDSRPAFGRTARVTYPEPYEDLLAMLKRTGNLIDQMDDEEGIDPSAELNVGDVGLQQKEHAAAMLQEEDDMADDLGPEDEDDPLRDMTGIDGMDEYGRYDQS